MKLNPLKSRAATVFAGFLALAGRAADPAVPVNAAAPPAGTVWVQGIGTGYVRGARFIDVEFTRGFGSTGFGGNLSHDLLLGRLRFSRSLNRVWAPDRWFGGNLLYTAEFMGGMQDHPDSEYLAFGNFGLRYDFATRSRFIPFVAASLGAGATGIGAPDLSEGVQFTQQVGFGLRCFVNERFSVNTALGYMHISNGGYRTPNAGINSFMVTLGVGWAF